MQRIHRYIIHYDTMIHILNVNLEIITRTCSHDIWQKKQFGEAWTASWSFRYLLPFSVRRVSRLVDNSSYWGLSNLLRNLYVERLNFLYISYHYMTIFDFNVSIIVLFTDNDLLGRSHSYIYSSVVAITFRWITCHSDDKTHEDWTKGWRRKQENQLIRVDLNLHWYIELFSILRKEFSSEDFWKFIVDLLFYKISIKKY